MQLHTPQGIREATPEEEAAIKAKFPKSDIDRLVEYAKTKGWI